MNIKYMYLYNCICKFFTAFDYRGSRKNRTIHMHVPMYMYTNMYSTCTCSSESINYISKAEPVFKTCSLQCYIQGSTMGWGPLCLQSHIKKMATPIRGLASLKQ
jgi:hypothetical protein